MSAYSHSIGARSFVFDDLKTLLARATPERSGDHLAGVAAASAEERAAAQMALAQVPLRQFLNEAVVPYESDEVTRLIIDSHDAVAFSKVAHFTVGSFREWLLSDAADGDALAALAPGLTPEMVAATSKIMRNQDLVMVARKVRVRSRFRSTIGLPGRLSTRLQPNHPTDDSAGIAASMLDGLLYGSGDAVIGINPATDNVPQVIRLVHMLDAVIQRYCIPTQSCVLTHVTNTLAAIERGAPVDLVFQSIGGTQATNSSFGIDLAVLAEARAAALSLRRGADFDGQIGDNVMYFETGQGSALSANAHHGCDQQTIEARAYAVARHFKPLLVNTVVGFIGPEYLYDGKQITRAGLEDHFCGKLLGLPMGCDICYTNHAEADQNDMDVLLTVLGVAGCSFIMGVPGSDDVMLNYQTTSFHDALYARRVLGLRPAPEFEGWLERMGVFRSGETARLVDHASGLPPAFEPSLATVSASAVVGQPFKVLSQFTPARIGLGRTGVSLPTDAQLDFQQAHARARDAVHRPLDVEALRAEIETLGLPTLPLHSAAGSRQIYLQRPDLGRRLGVASRQQLEALRDERHAGGVRSFDIAFAVVDGLSALAVQRHGAPLLAEVLAQLNPAAGGVGLGFGDEAAMRWRVAPVVVVEQGRVAVGDPIGELLDADIVVVLIGERPGLSSPDSLGIYFTWAPRPGRNDAERNCISNVRPEGLGYAEAATRLVYLLEQARSRQLTGVGLKDESGASALATEERSNFLLGEG
jgi:ethanolamine ammonia-lyase large subunit